MVTTLGLIFKGCKFRGLEIVVKMQKRMADEVQREFAEKTEDTVGTPVTSVEPSRIHTAWGYFNELEMAIAEK